MKKLIFVRHGKAEDEAFGSSDFERSLTTAGKKISKQMARLFIKKEDCSALYVSSPAFRALETAMIFAGECGSDYDSIVLKSSLYFKTDLRKVTGILSETDEDINAVIMFGHNPSFSDLADKFCKDGCDFMPKSSVVCISFDVNNWQSIKPGEGKLEYFLKPEKS